MGIRLQLSKENFKFSSAHFTIFSAERAERLHGHNYYLGFDFKFKRLDEILGMAADFAYLKALVREVVEPLDERVLLPARSPYLKIEEKGDPVEGAIAVAFGHKQYVFPREDVLLLPIVNVTSEELARFIARQTTDQWCKQAAGAGRWPLESLLVSIEETRGQKVCVKFRPSEEIEGR